MRIIERFWCIIEKVLWILDLTKWVIEQSWWVKEIIMTHILFKLAYGPVTKCYKTNLVAQTLVLWFKERS